MNILIFCTSYLERTQTFIYDQIACLKKIEKIFILCKKRANQDLFVAENIYQIHFSLFEKYLIKALKKLKIKRFFPYDKLKTSFQLKKIINDKSIDIIHIHFGTAFLFIANLLVKFNIPAVVTFHGFDASKKLYKKQYVKKLLKYFSYPNIYGITVSKDMKNRLIQFGLPENKLFVHYIGTNLSYFQKKERERKIDQSFSFLQVGRFVEKKGHKTTILAFKDFIEQNPQYSCKLVFAGDGGLQDEIKELVNQFHLENQIEFMGAVSHDVVKSLLLNCDVFISHSITPSNGDKEGIPIVLMEAMAMNIPILSSAHSGIPELVRDGVDGYLVEENNVTEYVNKMNLLLQNYNTLALNSRDFVFEHFNIVKNTTQLIGIYSTIIANTKGK